MFENKNFGVLRFILQDANQNVYFQTRQYKFKYFPKEYNFILFYIPIPLKLD